MNEIAAKLREAAKILPDETYGWLNPLMIEAAEEIERLDAANAAYCNDLSEDR
jgi:hypothetical protein